LNADVLISIRGESRIFMSRPRKRFTAAKEARRQARISAGSPPAGRVIPDKRRKPPKHKKKITDNDHG
jgi:hypothetical protein